MYPTKAPFPIDCPDFNIHRRGGCDYIGQADVVFIVDSSSSVKDDMWAEIQSWLVYVVNDVLTETSRVAIVQFGQTVSEYFNLETYSSKSEIINAILTMDRIGGATKTYDAVDYTLNNVVRISFFFSI